MVGVSLSCQSGREEAVTSYDKPDFPKNRDRIAQHAEAPSGAPDEKSPSQFHTEEYDPVNENIFHAVKDCSLSTFSVGGDTASYSNMLRAHRGKGQLFLVSISGTDG